MLRYSLRRPFKRAGRYAFIADLPNELVAQIQQGKCFVILREDGRVLGPGDTSHQTIRDVGGGAYSIWGSSVWFSSAANDDCNKNRRSYEAWVFDISDGSALHRTVLDKVARDDATLLQCINSNGNRNNSLLSNFFGYRHSLGEWIERAGATIPRRMIELGCGHVPWTGLRFLLDGTERYIANDIVKVRRSFPRAEINSLQAACGYIDPRLLTNWSRVFPNGDSDAAPIGLEVHDEAGFETLRLDEETDFTISTSVLEHVMDPVGIYQKLAEVTAPGGFMFHSIDLRDHRFFDTDPLAFLREPEEHYAPVKTENRLRASHHLELADQFGFDAVAKVVCLLQPSGPPIWAEASANAPLGISEAQRDQMDPEFRRLELLDLSTLALQVLFKKR